MNELSDQERERLSQCPEGYCKACWEDEIAYKADSPFPCSHYEKENEKISEDIDEFYAAVDPETAKREGRRRQLVHDKAGNSSPRFFDDRNKEHTTGIIAELGFAQIFGLKVDLNEYVHGDGGVDFRVGGVSIDVKGADKPVFLFLKEKSANMCADILVLAKVENYDVWLIGWTIRKVILAQPIKDFKKGIMNYYLHNSKLRTMEQLKELFF